jgi:hypothetical protein
VSNAARIAAAVGAVLIALLAVGWYITSDRSPDETVLDVVVETLAGPSVGESTPEEELPAASEAPAVTAANRGSAASPAAIPAVAPAAEPEPVAAGTPAGAADVAEPAAVVSSPSPSPVRHAHFLPGRTPWWTSVEVDLSGPIVLRAAGDVEAGTVASGPDGARRSDAGPLLALASAPYLALIGRVCSEGACTEPFLVGSEAVLCPEQVGMKGRLQLWTNNPVEPQPGQTALDFAMRTGGYSFYVEPAADEACGGSPGARAGLAMSHDARVLADGGVLSYAEFEISSSQIGWKPFFLPLDLPLRITATGSMRPAAGAHPTGPAGMAISSRCVFVALPRRADCGHRRDAPALRAIVAVSVVDWAPVRR